MPRIDSSQEAQGPLEPVSRPGGVSSLSTAQVSCAGQQATEVGIWSDQQKHGDENVGVYAVCSHRTLWLLCASLCPESGRRTSWIWG